MLTEKQLKSVNIALKQSGLQLSLTEEVKAPKADPSKVKPENIEIKEFYALPADYFMRESVVEAIRLELFEDLVQGKPLPSGVLINNMEVDADEQTKDIHKEGKSKPVRGSRKGSKRGGKDSKPSTNSRGKSSARPGGAKAPKKEQKGSKA